MFTVVLGTIGWHPFRSLLYIAPMWQNIKKIGKCALAQYFFPFIYLNKCNWIKCLIPMQRMECIQHWQQCSYFLVIPFRTSALQKSSSLGNLKKEPSDVCSPLLTLYKNVYIKSVSCFFKNCNQHGLVTFSRLRRFKCMLISCICNIRHKDQTPQIDFTLLQTQSFQRR